MSVHKRDEKKERGTESEKEKKGFSLLCMYPSPNGRREGLKRQSRAKKGRLKHAQWMPSFLARDKETIGLVGLVFIPDPWTGLRPGVRMRG